MLQLGDEAAKRLEEQAHRSQDAHGHKHPKEDSVDHHGNILPIILHLWVSEGTNASEETITKQAPDDGNRLSQDSKAGGRFVGVDGRITLQGWKKEGEKKVI